MSPKMRLRGPSLAQGQLSVKQLYTSLQICKGHYRSICNQRSTLSSMNREIPEAYRVGEGFMKPLDATVPSVRITVVTNLRSLMQA